MQKATKNHTKNSEKPKVYIIQRLGFSLLGLLIVFRFLFPFWANPVDHLFADAMHHWEAGKHLLNPTVMDAINPKFYQLYIAVLRWVSQDNPIIVALFTGVLCASLPYLWYRASREFLSKGRALCVALLIASCPTLWTIYAYMMNETLLLNLMALATWMSLRGVRKKTLGSFAIAVICWTLAAHTRVVALPFAGVFIVWMLWQSRFQTKHVLVMGAIILSVSIPAGLHSYQTLNIFAPLGYTGMIEAYRKSGSLGVEYTTYGAQREELNRGHLFMGPAIPGRSPLEPFVEYESDRTTQFYRWQVDLSKGTKDWEKAVERIGYTQQAYWRDVKENMLFFFFGHSWPEVAVPSWTLRQEMANEVITYLPAIETYHLEYRWLWSVYVWIIFVMVCHVPKGIAKTFMMGTLLAIIGLILQDTGLLTGRFRKPIEPYILLSFIVAVSCWRKKQ